MLTLVYIQSIHMEICVYTAVEERDCLNITPQKSLRDRQSNDRLIFYQCVINIQCNFCSGGFYHQGFCYFFNVQQQTLVSDSLLNY